MILQTNLKHIASEEEYHNLLGENPNLMLCVGRMGPMCVPVYAAMSELKESYAHVVFCDMAFDAPVATIIRRLPEVSGFMGLPFTLYFKDGQLAEATSSIQSKDKIKAILDRLYGKA